MIVNKRRTSLLSTQVSFPGKYKYSSKTIVAKDYAKQKSIRSQSGAGGL